jgi:hypothetical protein
VTLIDSRHRSPSGESSPREPAAPPADRRATGRSALERAIVRAVAYADAFDAALPIGAVHRAIDLPASPAEVTAALAEPGFGAGLLECGHDALALAGRGSLLARSARRRQESARRWPAARAFGRLIARLPFVRLVAVSGSLAADAADDDADVDLFIVTADGRLWLARAMTVVVVRLARIAGVHLCPNYLLAESAIELDDRSLFTAHELAQLVPVGGRSAYEALIERNRWASVFLPNAFEASIVSRERPNPIRRIAEWALRGRLVDRLEGWEMRRKVRRFTAAGPAPEARFDAACCKGHFEAHGGRALVAYASILTRLPEDAR